MRVVVFAVAVVVSFACSTSSSVPAASQRSTRSENELKAPDSVVVVNGAADPVRTQAVGTTPVSGTVAASQAGSWSVDVGNTVAVNASQQGAWNVGVTGGTVAATQAGAWNVNVASAPPVEFAAGATVAVSSLPAITLAGSPSVSVSSGSVTVANTSPILVRIDEGSAWGRSQTVTIAAGSISASLNTYTVPTGKRLVIESVSAFFVGEAPSEPSVLRVDTTTGGTFLDNYFDYGNVVVNGSTTRSIASHHTRLTSDPGSTIGITIFRSVPTAEAVVFVTMQGHLVPEP